jgi:hypothetical protein
MNKDSCEYKYSDNIIHIIYKNNIPNYIEDIANLYEGDISNRVGVNFPISILEKYKGHKGKLLQYSEAKYVIVYKKGDKMTKEHELMHAKYYIDDEYKKKVKEFWYDINESSRKKIILMLKKMGYPENTEILIDEFQAYYYTEKKNFFGKI